MKLYLYFLLFCCIVLFTRLAYSPVSTSENFNAYFPSGSSFIIQEIQYELTFKVDSGTLNATNCTLNYDQEQGSLFLKAVNTPFNFSCSNYTCDGLAFFGPTYEGSWNGSKQLVNIGDQITINFAVNLKPWLPILAILGMVGLGCMLVGPTYAIHLFQKGQRIEAIRTGVIFITLGFGFLLAWLGVF